MLNKEEIRTYMSYTLDDLKSAIDRDRNKTLKHISDKDIRLYKMGMVASLKQFKQRYSKVTKTYKKITDEEFNKLIGIEFDSI